MKSIRYTFKTHLGSQGRENGESYFHRNNLFFIVEGVGGEYLGEIARERAFSTIPDTFFRRLSEDNSPADALIDALKDANGAILAERARLGEKMAASISIVFIRDKIMYFTHLGDSRVYSIQGGELNQLTKDHTLKEEDPFAEKKYDDPRTLRALTQGLGIHEDPSIEVKKYPLHQKGLIVMTTEGLTERISNREILWMSRKTKDPKRLVNGLIDLTKRKGGNNHITVGIIRFGGISRGFRNILLAYSVFFIIALIFFGSYFLENGGEDIEKEMIDKTESLKGGKSKQEEPTSILSEKAPPAVEKTGEKVTLPLQKITNVRARIDQRDEAIGEKIHKQMEDFIKNWKTAWENTVGAGGDLEKYISFYSDEFQGNNLNRKQWKEDKARKGKAKRWIRLEFSDIKITGPMEDGRMEIRFSQNYRSSNFSVKSDKLLVLKKEGGGWKIIREKSS